MSYQVKNVLGLHARDASFFTRNLFAKALSGNRAKNFVICNSYPKSGTHLLYQILYSIPDLKRWDDIISVQALCGIMNTPHHIRWKLGSAPDNSIVRCHLMYSQKILDIFSEHHCKPLFIYRDLRDVAVSHARWVTKENRIFLHDIYQQQSTFDQQLMSSIVGVPVGTPFGSNLSQPNIAQDFSRWHGWLQHPATLAIKFEDLVGERGGGSEDKRIHIVEQIMDHLQINISVDEIKSKFGSYTMNPEESHTFKKGGKGSIGGWKKYFNDKHKTEFKKVAGNFLIELGYETSFDW